MIKKKIKHFFRTERAKFREMTFTEKRQYIWEYYKLQIFAAALLIFLIGYLINHIFINPPKTDYLYIAWVGEQTAPSILTDIGESLSIIVNNPYRESVSVHSYAFTDNPQIDSMTQQRFFAMLQVGSIDLFLTPHQGVIELAESELSRPMNEVMQYVATINPELYRQVTEQLAIITFELDGYTYTEAMAVSLANTPFFEYLNINANDIYLAVVINTQNFDRIAKALEAIFQWNPQ